MGKISQIRQKSKRGYVLHHSVSVKKPIEFSFVDNTSELSLLEAEWVELERSVASPHAFFQSYLWVSTWWNHFSETGRFQLKVITGRVGGRLVMVWPLAVAKRGWLRLLEPAGGFLSCFSDALVLDAPDSSLWLEKAVEHLSEMKGVDGFSFNGVHEESAIYDLIASDVEDVIQSGSSPEVRTKDWESFESFLLSRSKNFRKEIRGCRRQLESIGPVREAMNDPELTPREAVEVILKFKRDWIQDQGLRSKTVLSQKGEAFLSDYCEELAMRKGPGELQVNSVTAGDQMVACGIAFEYFGQQLEYIGGFDHEHRDRGAGKVQMASSIAHAIESGAEASNLLTPSTAYKSRWTEDAPTVVQIFNPLSFKGRFYRDVYLKWMRPRIKRVYHSTKSAMQKCLRRF